MIGIFTAGVGLVAIILAYTIFSKINLHKNQWIDKFDAFSLRPIMYNLFDKVYAFHEMNNVLKVSLMINWVMVMVSLKLGGFGLT
mgnify:CR=1 FL=1